MDEISQDYALPVEPDVAVPPVHIANELELTQLERGKVHRVFIELVGDGLATGVRVPLLVARGNEPGPVFGITSTIHGNELNGIPVIHDLFRSLDISKLRGTVVGVVAVNPVGMHNYTREFADGSDLNRIMPGVEGGSVGQVFAHRLLHRIVRHFDWLVDLHTASFGRVNSLYVRADMSHPDTAVMAYLQNPQILVHNPANDKTLRGAAMAMGIPAITVEIGDPQRWQRRYTANTLRGVCSVLAYAGLLPLVDDGFEMVEPVLCHRSFWLYTDRGGLLEVTPRVTDLIAKGQSVATVCNAFGDVIRTYRAPKDGVVVGHSTNPVGYTGARILHLGELAGPEHGLIPRDDAMHRCRLLPSDRG